ncbi:CoaE-domain-containing protein [Piedraia hortae CBS 480.64]|uniref:CoaE-domain-containing protein n=1 Tax=Piedraia hortae CBS 480.64 TaxID=1314780 RepID=A0A6A7BWZ9_9PEZI|nr:CoaE-domain-containing protein [Piedraia hortae CBS 480.64]
MLIIGLTGSIATGKSSVSKILSSPPYNIPVVDADKIARQVVEPGTPAYKQIVTRFGPSTPDLLLDNAHDFGQGKPLNRPALGRRVFGQGFDADRKALNGIVHPAVRKEMYRQVLAAYLKGSWAVVLDVPLLYESGWEPLCGTIIVVAVTDPQVQMRRLLERDEYLTEDDAKERVAAQWDVRDKAKRCEHRGPGRGVVLWNDGSKDELKMDVDRVVTQLKEKHPQWWTWMMLFCPPLAVARALWVYVRGSWTKRQWENEKRMEKARL